MNNGRVVVEFGQEDLETLLRWSTSSLASVRCAGRANMVLMAATGFSDRAIAQELGAGAPRVRRWVALYVKLGLMDGLNDSSPIGVASRYFSDRGISRKTPEICSLFQPFWAFFSFAGHWPCFRAHSCPGPQQLRACHPQVGQRKQRDNLGGVLLESAVANLHKAELALDHPKGMLHFGPDACLVGANGDVPGDICCYVGSLFNPL